MTTPRSEFNSHAHLQVELHGRRVAQPAIFLALLLSALQPVHPLHCFSFAHAFGLCRTATMQRVKQLNLHRKHTDTHLLVCPL